MVAAFEVGLVPVGVERVLSVCASVTVTAPYHLANYRMDLTAPAELGLKPE